jgi:hypothetical protein
MNWERYHDRRTRVNELLLERVPCVPLVTIIILYQERHDCDIALWNDFLYCGQAFENIWEDHEGRLFVENDEYGTRVRFCPLCGAEASNNRDWKSSERPIF